MPKIDSKAAALFERWREMGVDYFNSSAVFQNEGIEITDEDISESKLRFADSLKVLRENQKVESEKMVALVKDSCDYLDSL